MSEISKFENARRRASKLLEKMTLTEKIGQLSQFGTSIYSDDHKAFEDHFAEGKIGSYLTIRDRKRINEIQSELVEKSPNHIPALFADDVIHGYKTTFPIPLAQSCSWDPEMTEKCCAISAKEAGATVALIQKEATAISQGNTATGILLDGSDPAGVSAVVSTLLKEHQFRGNRAQVELWAKNSGEAITWVFELAQKVGAQVSDTTKKWTSTVQTVNGYPLSYLSIDFGPKPYNTGDGMRALADYAEEQGVEIFYNTEAKQLVGDADSGITGVIAKGADGNIQFNAKKGVILATGDYQNDDEMMDYYLPDLHYLGRKQNNKTGDGIKMAVWAGGQIEPIAHTKMLHDFDAGPGSMCDMPFLAVKMNGERFADETAGMSRMNCFLRSEEDAGNYCQIFDSNYMTQAASWPGKLFDPDALKAYMPEESGEKKGVYEDQVATFKADTLDELATKLGITDAAAFKKSVERYNALAAEGKDEDFGKDGKWLTTIDTPPFYGIHRKVRVSAIVSGVHVGEHMEVLKADSSDPIKGLYAIGNTAGDFYGGIDYTMWMPGLSLGRAHTQGYVMGKYVANL